MGAKKSSKSWKLFGVPFWKNPPQPQDTQPIVYKDHRQNYTNGDNSTSSNRRQRSLAAMERAYLLTWWRLNLILTTSSSYSFQKNAPKSCFMRPPNSVLAPKESILASVVKFVEEPDHPEEKKATKDKFKIVSLKVKQGTEYSHGLFEDHKDLVFVERVLRVVFLVPERPSKDMEKLKKWVAEAEAPKQAPEVSPG